VRSVLRPSHPDFESGRFAPRKTLVPTLRVGTVLVPLCGVRNVNPGSDSGPVS
jgi:hypothetical protein